MFELPDASGEVAAALAEDLGVGPEAFAAGRALQRQLLERDVTSFSVVGLDAVFSGRVVAREECVCVRASGRRVDLRDAVGRRGPVRPGRLLPAGGRGISGSRRYRRGRGRGLAVAVLAAERTALDFMMVLSGIATETARWVEAAGPDLAVCDTRKTLPGLRALSKYAVRVGGGTNHRVGLFDMVLVKDNHLARAGSVARAVELARARGERTRSRGRGRHRRPGARGGAGRRRHRAARQHGRRVTLRGGGAVPKRRSRLGRPCLTEASGGIGFERLPALRRAGVDRVSSSALTLAPPVDFGFDEA